MENKNRRNIKKLIINIPEELNEKIVDIASLKGLTKTQMVLFAINKYIDERETTEYLPKMIDILYKYQDKLINNEPLLEKPKK